MWLASEKNFENRIKDFLKSEGCYFIKYWSGNAQNGKKFTRDGVPDILCCCRGFFLGIEVKAPNGKPSPLQIYNLNQIDKSGGFAILLYPEQFQLFKNFILCVGVDDENASKNYELLKERWWKECQIRQW
jgi:hypothetical protein|nr:MAG TPA: Nuclease [Caudoviricetes sp.]